MTSGGLTAILLSVFMELTGPPRRRIQTRLNVEALPRIQDFLGRFASRARMGEEIGQRLNLAAEETLLLLVEQAKDDRAAGERRLRVTARADAGGAELEFLAVTGEGNLEDRLALLGGLSAELPVERDVSLRLLRHIWPHRYATRSTTTRTS